MAKGTLRVPSGAAASIAMMVLMVLLIVPWLNLKTAAAARGVSEVDGVVERFYTDKFGRAFMGGDFTRVNDQSVSNITVWEEGIWRNLGTGTDGIVRDIEVSDDGRVYIAGDFKTAGGVRVNHIAVWIENSWQPLGTGTNRRVTHLQWLASGDLLVVGDFTVAGGEVANTIALWDGERWLPDVSDGDKYLNKNTTFASSATGK